VAVRQAALVSVESALEACLLYKLTTFTFLLFLFQYVVVE